jgi:ComF family protein
MPRAAPDLRLRARGGALRGGRSRGHPCLALAEPLGDLLAETRALLPEDAVDLVVPVPLHRRRQRERGFNQSWLLARRLAASWGVQALPDVLVRARGTLPQTDLGAAERCHNVRGAFRVSRPEAVRGRHVVLVDDIMTTGATAGECAALLGAGGATTVGVLTVARVAR